MENLGNEIIFSARTVVDIENEFGYESSNLRNRSVISTWICASTDGENANR